MLTEVKAYSSWEQAPTLLLDSNGSAQTDLIQVREITGLDPVKASVNVSPFGSVDGSAYVGSDVLSRNIVLTLGLNPDWDTWTYEALRRLIYSYFMPKRPTKLQFESDDIPPVEISGIVESAEVNHFSKSPEMQVSVVCPDPYFSSIDPVVITGQSIRKGGATDTIDYEGSVETGIRVLVSESSGANPTSIGIQVGDPTISYFDVMAGVDASKYFEMSSVPLRKYVQNVDLTTGVITNLLSKTTIREGDTWPSLHPGETDFSVVTDAGVQDWELRYYLRYGGL